METALIVNCSPVRTGATAQIADLIRERLSRRFDARGVCIDDYRFAFCRGCRRGHTAAACAMQDGVQALMAEFDRADVIVCVSPSYWADVPGQFKAFIDRCTPWCNTHQPHAALRPGKRGYAVALRTGPGMKECERILDTLEHFYGHLEIERSGRLGLCGVENRRDATAKADAIRQFCEGIL